MQNEYILANPQKKALILQAVNNKITRLEQVSKGKETGKNLANLDEINGGITDAFKGTARGADVAATFTGENPMVEVDNQYGYMIYDQILHWQSILGLIFITIGVILVNSFASVE